jgi:hypothetical protein
LSALAALAAAWLLTSADAPTAAAADPEVDATPAPKAWTPSGPDQDVNVTAAYQAAEQLQGPLDGMWKLVDDDGRTLYIFSLSDAGAAPAPLAGSPDNPGVEGAWRDPAHPGDANASGFIDSVSETGDQLRMRFTQGADRHTETLTLKAAATGRWTGDLAEGDARRPVVMTRF